ncbi:MAG: ATP-grasp domain-containing protein [Pseudomonadota bacterium]
MKTALVTLGRLPKGLALCRALARAGWRVVVAEPSKRHLCGLSKYVAASHEVTAPNTDRDAYLREMLDVVARETVSLIVPVSEEIMHVAALGPMLPGGVHLFCQPFDRLLELHDKFRFNRLAAGFGLPVPKTHLPGTPEAAQLAASHDVVLKPGLGCAGMGVEHVTAGAELPRTGDGAILVQKALLGRHTSSFSIVHEGQVLGTVVYTPEVVSNTVAAAFRRVEGDAASHQAAWVERFVAGTGHSGFISLDFIDDEAGIPHAIECNPRTTSGIHFVDEDWLARAITAPESAGPMRLKPHPVMHQFWPVLTEVQGAMFRPGRGYGHKMGVLLKSKEVNFEWGDAKPVTLQVWAAWDILRRSAQTGESFGEASTFDIAWKG